MGFLKKKKVEAPIANPTPIAEIVQEEAEKFGVPEAPPQVPEIEVYDPESEEMDNPQQEVNQQAVQEHVPPTESVEELKEKIRIEELEIELMKKKAELEEREEEAQKLPPTQPEQEEEEEDEEQEEMVPNQPQLTEEVVKQTLMNHEQRVQTIESRLFQRGV